MRTSAPASVRTLAAMPPPAPDPMMHTSKILRFRMICMGRIRSVAPDCSAKWGYGRKGPRPAVRGGAGRGCWQWRNGSRRPGCRLAADLKSALTREDRRRWLDRHPFSSPRREGTPRSFRVTAPSLVMYWTPCPMAWPCPVREETVTGSRPRSAGYRPDHSRRQRLCSAEDAGGAGPPALLRMWQASRLLVRMCLSPGGLS